MATHQEGFFIKRLELSEKYQFESNRIFTMCRAIEGYTRCRIDIQIMHTGVRFEVIGSWSGVKKALENIQQNFCRATITGDKHAKAHSSRKVLRSMKKEDQNKILEGGVDPGQPLLTEAVLRQHNLLHEVYELREFACLRCRQYWWRKVLTTKRVSMCKGCGVKYDALRRDKEFGIGRYMCQNKNCNRTFYRFCHATLACKCKECYEMVHHPHVHPRFRKTLKIRKPLDPDTTLYDPYEGEAVQKKSGGEGFEPYERKKKRKYIFNPSTRHQSTGSTEMTFLTQAIRSDIGDDNNSEIISIASSTDSFSSSDNGSDSDSTPNQSDDDSQIESSVSTIPPSDSDNDSECDTSSSHPNQKRELGTYSSDDSSENDDNDDKTPSETESADSGKFSSLASTIQDSGIGTASNIDTVSTADSANNTADSANTTAATVHTTSHGWKRSSTIKPDYLPVKFSRREFRENVDHHGADIIGEGIHVIIPPDAIHQGNISVTVQACLGGPFEIPSDYEPISPVYLLHPPYVFQTEVELKIKVFADIEENDDIIFLTSQDKPTVRKKQNIWIFMEEAKDVSAKVQPFSAGSREVSVSVRHFCFGLLARRRKKRQKSLYVVCLYYFLVPSCRAIFTASLDSDVYINEFEEYLKRDYKDNQRYGTPRHTRLSADKIELVLPKSTEVQIILDSSPCIIKKEFLDLPKRKKRGTSSLYPPWFSMSIHGTSEQHQVCTFGVKGTEEEIEFNVEVPPSRPPSLSTHSSRSEASDCPTYVSIVDHVGVSESLLSRKCSSEHLRKIADFVPNWRELAMSLGIQKGYIIDINSDRQLTGPVMKAQSVLDQWHRSNGFMASHKMLIQAFISQGDADLAERVCRIAKKELEADI